MRVSHQTIYRWRWANPAAFDAVSDCLRYGRYRRRRLQRLSICNRVSIQRRLAVVEAPTRVSDTIVARGT